MGGWSIFWSFNFNSHWFRLCMFLLFSFLFLFSFGVGGGGGSVHNSLCKNCFKI